MSSEIKHIHRKLSTVVESNFLKIIRIKGIVCDINAERRYVFLKSLDNNQILKCQSQDTLPVLSVNDLVVVVGIMVIDELDAGSIYLKIKHISKQAEYDPTKSIILHDKLIKVISSNACSKQMERIRNQKFPYRPYNIALIVVPSSRNLVEQFKTEFKRKCVGNLYVFNLEHENTDVSLTMALEYFIRYKNIDLVLLLEEKIGIKEACDLSSKNITKFFLSRRGYPYIISITGNSNNFEPVTTILSNEKIPGIVTAIERIHQIQYSYQKKISEAINLAQQRISTILEAKTKKLNDLNIETMKMFQKAPPVNNVDQLKILLKKKFDNELRRLDEIEIDLTHNLISCDPIQKIIHSFNVLKPDVFLKLMNGISDMINKEKQHAPTIHTNDNSSSEKFKEFALKQNLNFQSRPQDIPESIQSHDNLINEMSNRLDQTNNPAQE